ncbi:MAG TPA: deoxyribonuclease V [Candidatus Krumholzibacteriaceae bacterium]|nr:deoxyribonuclease V [Candidatus Krumholzibacteriaceae bacterium]
MKKKIISYADEFVPAEGIKLQKKLRSRVILKWDGRKINLVAGIDVHFPEKNTAFAAVALFSYPQLELVDSSCAARHCDIAYIPGLLSFREIPPILKAWNQLRKKPDLILCDGQGIAHPRGLGLASHLGIELDLPTIGCAKSPLFGKYDLPPPLKGDKSPIFDKERNRIGYVLRTRDNVKPLYISPGHLIDIETSVDIVLSCTTKYKISEPLRAAHRMAGGN